ncbi:hypothetical protein OG758_12400 [Streptomyces sp. NBC_01474]|uniref:hypothetical protein n=1 Tax=Streptomyces sp. NBC_01474 TaxID=2903880 RepID=UPI002DDAA916|nr:hypothetical protein [Streptomyces sp. NBC_01474]WSD94859.1 hypothetical protein OG758_12400 [Streptomyces sp. NBC_01474]
MAGVEHPRERFEAVVGEGPAELVAGVNLGHQAAAHQDGRGTDDVHRPVGGRRLLRRGWGRVARNRGAEETLEQLPASYGVHVMTPSMDAPRDYRMLAVAGRQDDNPVVGATTRVADAATAHTPDVST